jgi:serine/threonine protein kinase
MRKPNYICKNIDQQTKIYFINPPDPQLIKLTHQLFHPFISNLSETQFNEKYQVIHIYSISEVYCFEYQKEVYYAKKFIFHTLEHTISQTCKGPKGVRCMTFADNLTSLGLKAPESVFVISHHNSFLAKENIYLTKKYCGFTLKDFIFNNIHQSKEKVTAALLDFTTALGAFYKNRFSHCDLHFENFLINEAGEIAFIDLNDINYSPILKSTLNQTLKGLAQLNARSFADFVQNSMSNLYTPERVIYYLKNFLKYYQPQADVLKVFTLLNRETFLYLSPREDNSLTTLFCDTFNPNP